MEIRDKVFSLRLTQSEYEYLKTVSKSNGQTIASLIRLLIEKYKEQLKLYSRAIEEALNRKVDEVYIYSTHLNKEVKVK